MRGRGAVLVVATGLIAGTPGVHAQTPEDLGRFFGFDPARILVADPGCGPVINADFNKDGLDDLALVNNRKSRIELHLVRSSERSEEETTRKYKVNELPPNPWYDRVEVSVPHRVNGVRAIDFDADGLTDLVYSGSNPSEIVFLRQTSPSKFEQVLKRRVNDLDTRPYGFFIADVEGDAAPEVVALADGKVNIFPMTRRGLGEQMSVGLGDPTVLSSTNKVMALVIEDFNGDGMSDVLGVNPEDSTPLRLWLQRQDPRGGAGGKAGLLSAELRFDMPALREVEAVRFPGRAAASIAVIERASRRSVYYDLVEHAADAQAVLSEANAELTVQGEATAFADDNKDRAIVVADVDGDGLTDLLTTNIKTNTIDLYRQTPGLGLGQAESFSAFKKPKQLAVGFWRGGKDGNGIPDVIVLSEEEKAIGVSRVDPATGRLGFPEPLPVKTAGGTPVAMDFVQLDTGPRIAVVVKDVRTHYLEMHAPPSSGSSPTVESVTSVLLENVSRPPQSMLATDADRDGRVDILLFTPNEPMVMVRATGGEGDKGFEVLNEKKMAQFGLVQSAGPDNTVLFDLDGDGHMELLIAADNFVRACSYDGTAGWKVDDQVTISDPGTRLVGLGLLKTADGPMIVASDKGNSRLILIGRDSESKAWKPRTRLRIDAIPLGRIACGNFTGARAEPHAADTGILCLAPEAFGLVRLRGQRQELESFAAFRAEDENRLEHEMAAGDVNGDGFTDTIVLDATEQMCQIFTFSAARKLHFATEFEVFQSRLFRGGASREYEPRAVLVADATGDKAEDIVLVVHDRVIIYPQATEKR